MNEVRPGIFTLCILAIVIAVAGMVLHRSPFNASDLGIVPDSVEYAVAGNRIVTDGKYDIVINGRHFPPRYPPWFSLFLLAPSYLVFGAEIGNAIYPVTLLAVIGVIAAFMIGRKVAEDRGGLFAALALLIIPAYHRLGREVMTDVPCVALILLQCLIYMRLRAERCTLPLFWYSIAGILAAVSGSFRPACYSTLIPFVLLAISSRDWKEKALRAFLTLFPGFAMLSATLHYNAVVIGSPFRSGYNFWCPVPYDYFHMVFSRAYVLSNLKTAAHCGLVPLMLAVVILAFTVSRDKSLSNSASRGSARAVMDFALLGTGPIAIVHLAYFFPDGRFFLPSTSLLAVATGGLFGLMLTGLRKESVLLIGLLGFAAAAFLVSITPDKPPYRRMAAENIKWNTPEDARVISCIDPAYLGFFISADCRRRVIPLSRNVEYASKLIAPSRIRDPQPPPRNCADHRCAGLLNGGAREVILRVFDENSDVAVNNLVNATTVYLDTSAMRGDEVRSVFRSQRTFDAIKRVDCLYELVPRKPQLSLPADVQAGAGTWPQHISDTQTSDAR